MRRTLVFDVLLELLLNVLGESVSIRLTRVTAAANRETGRERQRRLCRVRERVEQVVVVKVLVRRARVVVAVDDRTREMELGATLVVVAARQQLDRLALFLHESQR